MGFWGTVIFVLGGLFLISFLFGPKGKRTKTAAKETAEEFPKVLILALLVFTVIAIFGLS